MNFPRRRRSCCLLRDTCLNRPSFHRVWRRPLGEPFLSVSFILEQIVGGTNMIFRYLGIAIVSVAALSFASTADARSHHKRHHYSSMNSMEPKAGANSSPTHARTTTPPPPSSNTTHSGHPKPQEP